MGVVWRRLAARRGQPLYLNDHERWLTKDRARSPWLRLGICHAQQMALRGLDQACRNHEANPTHFAPPTWRKHGSAEGFAVSYPIKVRNSLRPIQGRVL